MSERVAVVDCGSGNLRSAEKALVRAARGAGIDRRVAVTADPDAVRRADRLVLPGVGAFAECRDGLARVAGMLDALDEACRAAKPILGICVGMQLLASRGHEYRVEPGLDWIAGEVQPLKPADRAAKIPHMGWNRLTPTLAGSRHPLLDGIGPGAHMYFVHSYHFVPAARAAVLAESDHGGRFVAAIGRDTVVGTQFHPEKSQQMGQKLLENFLRWRP
ncbi:imidazole glycerol phosphate synthase subunit HisH [Rhodothalassium salexigens DSM 2132]|uniref:Imidazole glycerol phosphate synthase subunit HisH n=1 Tax=Rhodothalassium salexigens DSM 2132 TaxID=1188247 RepID=A0A4V2SPR3_RHOSA|nr:imidazole glycerol phosphate synthase subunit HisH [Rhodothalassium salexigens]MBB4211168.1 glutamine amidotransferase [Rhodothalassium salexigens DSM 2132]MBK1637509.1 imidazole glycerol phosphate synthase subunit HisH [Rhodothalassium salexigens DSM 2132]TCP36176.1 imidazole glycerol phosphate synthase subunit HisH [Rhodothalassium salexigens DSM 2132]